MSDDFRNSIVLTVHNKASTIGLILDAIFQTSSTATVELIIILDGCNDGTDAVVLDHISKRNRFDIAIEVFKTDDIWETRANNVGIKLCKSPYVTIIQDDMLIKHHHWDTMLFGVFKKFDIFSVSGRACHDFAFRNGEYKPVNVFGREFPLGSTHVVGKIAGRLMAKFKPFFLYRYWAPINFALTANRGPLMFRLDQLKQLDFLDERFAPFEMDDADICCRAYKKWGLKSACRPIYYVELNGSKATNSKSAQMSVTSIKANTKTLMDRHLDLAKD